jgi:hypothetical protein
MIALEMLAKARGQGAKPAVAFVTLGEVEQFPWWRDGTAVEIVIPGDKPVARIDFRPLVGCDVILIAWKRDDRLRTVTELLCAQVVRLTVLSSEDPDDLGHAWERGAGWRKIGERRAA